MEDVKALIQTLESMIDAHKRLLETAKAKRMLLVESDTNNLKNIVHQESAIVDEIQKFEQLRKQHAKDYMNQRGISNDSPTLEDVVNIEGNPFLKNRLQSIAKQLKVLIKEITHMNESNQQLIQASLSYVQYSIGMLVKKEPAIGYGPKSSNRYANMLDAKI
jgi:flagellar biosynthesis/type III secretory pathway chaperone